LHTFNLDPEESVTLTLTDAQVITLLNALQAAQRDTVAQIEKYLRATKPDAYRYHENHQLLLDRVKSYQTMFEMIQTQRWRRP